MKNQTIWNRKNPKSSPHGQDYGLSGHHSDYGEGSVPGLKISDVSKGSPADKAGLTAGDIIVELAGRKIENIYDYTYAIDAVRIGQPTLIIIRDNNKIELEIVPGSRE